MTRDELVELLQHAEIEKVSATGPEHGPHSIDSLSITFRWLSGERRSVILNGMGDVCGWIEIEEPGA